VYFGEEHKACSTIKELDDYTSIGIYARKTGRYDVPPIPIYAVQDDLSTHYEMLLGLAGIAGKMNGRADPFNQSPSSVLNRDFTGVEVMPGDRDRLKSVYDHYFTLLGTLLHNQPPPDADAEALA